MTKREIWKEYSLPVGVAAIGIVIMILGSGCTTPQEKHLVARVAYNGTMTALNAMVESGDLDADDQKEIEPIRLIAWEALEAWQQALDNGMSPDAAMAAFTQAIINLRKELK